MQIGGSIGISILAVLHQYLITFYKQKGAAVASHDALKGAFLLATAIVVVAIWPAFRLKKEVKE